MRTARLNNQRKVYESLLRERGKVRALDIGCGPKKFKHAFGLDVFPQEGVDVLADTDSGSLPFRNGSFDMVVANHFIEHVGDIRTFMMEVHRVLAPGGIAVIRTPYFSNEGSFRDPSHKWHLTLKSMDYFAEGSPLRWPGLPGYFEKVCVKLEFGKGILPSIGRLVAGLSLEAYENNCAHIFPAQVVFWALRAVK